MHHERPRLSAQLDRGVDDQARLTLVSAPPGYGKTVAVAGWLQARTFPHAWISLDTAENDPARFARYLVAALGAVRSGLGEATLGLFGPGASPAPELVGATLLDELTGAGGQRMVLVLDDYHLITAQPVHALVRFLVERGTPLVRLAVLTREDPPLPLARLRAHGQLVEVRADDLRAGEDEAAGCLAESGVQLPCPLLERLVERTEGWIAGLQLAALCLKDRADPATVVDAFSGSQRFVLDYLAEEVLARLDPNLRAFLVQTSIADRFTAGLCEALTGRADAAALLAQAERANLFLVPLDQERRWYRYHHLFADELRGLLPEAERRALHTRAAVYLEGEGLRQEATGQALASGDHERAVALLEREARPTFEAGEFGTLLDWLRAVPPERLATSAELASLQAWALFNTGRLAEAETCARTYLAGADTEAVGRGRMLVLRALAQTFSGPDAERLARAGLALLQDDDPLFESKALQSIGLAQLAQGRLAAAVDTLRSGVTAALRSGHASVVLPAMTPLAQALNAAGQRDEAEALCRRVLAEHAHTTGAWPARAALGLLRYEAGDVSEALRELEADFDTAARLGTGTPMLLWALPYLALARLAAGAPEAALEATRIAGSEAQAAGLVLSSFVEEIEARVHLASGDLVGAARWADAPPPDFAGSPLGPTLRRSHDMTVARVRLAQGRPEEALALLAHARRELDAQGVVADLISVHVLESAAASALGHRAEAIRSLEAAVRLAAPAGYLRRILDDGRAVAHLLPLVRAIAPGFVDRALRTLESTKPSMLERSGPRAPEPGDGAAQAEPLTPREQDVLRLMAQGASNAEIAAALVVSVGTARWHVGHILAKLGAASRTQALVRAQQLGLV